MEALDKLKPNLPVSVLNVSFRGGGPADVRSRRHHTHFIRVVDLAVEEYEVARRSQEYSDTNLSAARIDAAFHAISHLELSVVTARRALAALEAIASDPGSPEIDRLQRRLIRSLEKEVKDVRDFIVHTDEKIRAGLIKEGESHALRIERGGSTASIGQHRLSLSEFSSLLEKLHELASSLARFKEEAN